MILKFTTLRYVKLAADLWKLNETLHNYNIKTNVIFNIINSLSLE